MSITTKKGDGGRTSLLSGERVKKDDLRIEICGTLDELSSYLGVAKSLSNKKENKGLINKIQSDLIVIGSEVAACPSSVHRLRKTITKKDIRTLEAIIEKLEKRFKSKECAFVIPGKDTLSAALHVARTIARKLERRIVTLKRKNIIKNDCLLIYLNRLSDLLYLMTRSCVKKRTK